MRVKKSAFSKGFYLWSRDIHLYVGLFASPYVIVFALSTILLNHNWNTVDNAEIKEWESQVELKEGLEPRQLGFDIAEQLGLQGEVGQARKIPAARAQLFPGQEVFQTGVNKLGQNTRIEVDPETGLTRIRQTTTGAMRAIIEMHMRPGPHSPRSLMSWIFSKIWAAMSDAVVYLLLFLSISGIYLWFVLKAERKIGWIMTLAGLGSFAFIIAGFLWA